MNIEFLRSTLNDFNTRIEELEIKHRANSGYVNEMNEKQLPVDEEFRSAAKANLNDLTKAKAEREDFIKKYGAFL